MTVPRPAHVNVVPPAVVPSAAVPPAAASPSGARSHAGPGGEPALPRADISVSCHRRLRGPYTGGGTLLRELVVPELLEHAAHLLAPRVIEIIALAPELGPSVPSPPWTLTEHAEGLERTRYYGAGRTRRLAHGIAELLDDWARTCRPGGVVVEFRDVDHADPTDLELIAVLLRRCDPGAMTLVVDGAPADGEQQLRAALEAHARRVEVPRQATRPEGTPDGDLAQRFIDSDGTDPDPAAGRAYAQLPLEERARRHSARAEELDARGEPTLFLGAIPYHVEHGVDPHGTGVETMYKAMIRCLHLGFYDAAMDLALRGRRLTTVDQPRYAAFTHKIGACLAYLDRGWEAIGFFTEQRRVDTDPEVHMGAAYMLSMLYTRHLPRPDHDEDAALEWVNTAIALGDQHPDADERVFRGAFMRNARALVELHRGNLEGALALVNEAARRMDANFGPTEHQLHRSVLKYNRGLVLAGLGQHEEALAAFDEVIAWDPEYADYYFERAGLRRDAGWYDGAFEDYDRAVSLSPPFFEVYVNRADMQRELGDDEGALRDLDYALELEPDLVDSLINRADILLARGETERAAIDVRHGLTLEPANPHLLTAQGSLLAEAGDGDGALACYTAALREAPGFVAALANRAVLSYSLGRVADAVDDLDRAVELADDPGLRSNRAVALQDLGDHRRALADLDVVLAGPGGHDPELFYRRGLSRQATGDLAGAAADWRAHLESLDDGLPSPHLEEIRRLEAALEPGGTAATRVPA